MLKRKTGLPCWVFPSALGVGSASPSRMHFSLCSEKVGIPSFPRADGSRVKVDETRNSSRARVQLNDGVCWWIPVLLDSFEWFHAGSTVRREEWMPPWMHPKVEVRTCIRDSAFASCMDAVQVRFSSHFLPLFGVLSGHWVVRFWNPVQRQKYSFQHVSFYQLCFYLPASEILRQHWDGSKSGCGCGREAPHPANCGGLCGRQARQAGFPASGLVFPASGWRQQTHDRWRRSWSHVSPFPS